MIVFLVLGRHLKIKDEDILRVHGGAPIMKKRFDQSTSFSSSIPNGDEYLDTYR